MRIQQIVAGLCVIALTGTAIADDAKPLPKVGDTATDFTLMDLEGEKVMLSKVTAKSPVVLLVLRGYPGYQCPICNRQVGQFLTKKDDFEELGAKVLLVYPGPKDALQKKAKAFLKDVTLPEPYTMLLDPNYKFTNAYNLRWDAPRETAYPSTFVIDTDRKIQFAQISKTHGGRTKPQTILEKLKTLK